MAERTDYGGHYDGHCGEGYGGYYGGCYGEYYEKIYRYCYFRLRNRETAEDITQETFLRFIRYDSDRSDSCIGVPCGSGSCIGVPDRRNPDRKNELPLLYTIARNLCIDEARKKKDVMSVQDYERYEGAYEFLPNTDGGEEGVVARQALAQAMMRLERDERELVYLRYVDGLTPAQIGKMRGMSRFAVYRRCEKALKKLRREMEG